VAERRQLEKAQALELFEQSELLMSRLALVEAQRDDGAGVGLRLGLGLRLRLC